MEDQGTVAPEVAPHGPSSVPAEKGRRPPFPYDFTYIGGPFDGERGTFCTGMSLAPSVVRLAGGLGGWVRHTYRWADWTTPHDWNCVWDCCSIQGRLTRDELAKALTGIEVEAEWTAVP